MTDFPTTPVPPVQSDAPAVVRYMQENKLLLEARDADQMQLMVQRWLYMEDQLGARISDLTQHLAELKAAGEPITQEMLMAKQRYQRLLWQVQQELEDYTEFAAELIAKSQQELGEMGLEHAAQAVQLALGESAPGMVGAYFDKLPISAVENMVGVTAAGSPVAEVLAKHWPDAVQKMTDILVRNTGLGINPRQTAREMADGMAAEGLNNAMTVARTEQLRVYREASRQQYVESGLVPQYRRMCARQSRTCMACIALDGEIYDTEDLMELHPNDRCVMIPIVAGMPPIEMETGKEWFEKQPEHVQREMMGPGRHDLYKSGQVSIDDMVVTGTHPDWGPTASVRSLESLQGVEYHKVTGPAGSLTDSFSYRESKAAVHFDNAISDLDDVFVGMDDLDIKVSGYSGRGEAKYNNTTGKIKINNSAQQPEFSFVHETGHAMDYRVLPDALGIEGANATMGSLVGGTPMDDFWDAIDNSSAVKKLQAMRGDDPDGIAYLLDVRELHARAFTQYVAETSGSKILLEQLDEIREFSWYPDHWTKKDFVPIKKALDKLYGNAGLLH